MNLRELKQTALEAAIRIQLHGPRPIMIDLNSIPKTEDINYWITKASETGILPPRPGNIMPNEIDILLTNSQQIYNWLIKEDKKDE